MRDDNYRNQRPPEQYRRPAANAGPAQADPLAELARLIGQNDPFSDFARDQGRGPAPGRDPRYADPAPADWQTQPPSYREAPQIQKAPQFAPAHGDVRGAPEERQGYGEFGRDGSADDRHFAPQEFAPGFAPQGFAHQDYDQQPQDYAQPGGGPAGYNYDQQQPYDDPRYAAYGHDQQQGYAPQFGRGQGPQGHPHDPYYRGVPHDGDMYEDQPRARRRGGMLTVMAVLTLAVVGTAAAFGYRTLFSGSGAVLSPPTIKADAGPNKVVPATQAADPSGKLIYDRVGDKNQQQERMVSREEQPVDMKSAAPPPRVVLSSGMPNPAAPVPSSPVPPAPQAFPPPPGPAAAANVSTEPKKVRTLTIRPDQPAAAPETTRSAPQPTRTAAVEEPAPTSTPVRTTTIRQQAPQSDPNAPLSLTPGRQQGGAMRTASAPASQPMATSSGGGAYAVQVTSQRTEAEAQSSYQALQAKYPSVLGNRQAMIRRADLGDRGTYYRAQVPFGTQGEASEFCASLKAAGGQCVVQRN